ncbi:hypothetical protein AN958_08288 [Leucoagaricus sp. SymC.cos]|nr:hypothetical protein AN958_08288 [Leucoagaricus sp. SymC.cos]
MASSATIPATTESTGISFGVEWPQDIARVIFEMTMSHRPVPVHLALVSRQVKDWVYPLIYRNLFFGRFTQFNTFHRRFNSTDPGFRRFCKRHVKGVFIRADVESDDVARLVLNLHAGLEALAIWGEVRPEAQLDMFAMEGILRAFTDTNVQDSNLALDQTRPQPLFPNLRRVSFSGQALCGNEITFAHLFFKNLTHVDIYFCRDTDWSLLRQLHALTHLSFNELDCFTERGYDVWMAKILKACPSSVQVIIFGCVHPIRSWDFYTRDVEGNKLNEESGKVSRLIDWIKAPVPGQRVPENYLEHHAISRLIAGWVDPRAVAGCLTSSLPSNHVLYDYIVYSPRCYPGDLFHSECGDGMSRTYWEMAEDLIRRRKEFG